MSSSWAEFDFGTTSSSSTSPPNNSSSSNHNYRLSSAMSGGGGGKARGSWEDLRKEVRVPGLGLFRNSGLTSRSLCSFQARQLENQIDMKLVSFSKIGSSMGSSGGSSTSASAASSSDKQPLLSADAVNPSEQFASMTAEIDSFLNRLSHINEGMTEYAAGQPQSAAIHHTLQRHRDILQDYRYPYSRHGPTILIWQNIIAFLFN